MSSSVTRRQFVTGLAASAALGAATLSAVHGQEPTGAASGARQPGRRRNSFAVSLNSYTWGKFDVAQCLAQIRQTPIRLLELPVEQTRPGCLIPELMIDTPLNGAWKYSFPDFQKLLAKDGFQVDSVDVFGYMGYRGSEGIIKRRIDFAQRLGASIMVLGCHHAALRHGPASAAHGETAAQREAKQGIYSILREVADYAKPKSVKIALEIHGGVTANAAEALRTLREVGRDNLGINFDVANILIYNRELDPAGGARELKTLAKHVFHVHLKDVVRTPGEAKFVMPRLGKGEVDFRKVFDVLHGAGFYGPFSFEVETFHGATASDDIRQYHQDVLASIDYIRSLGEFDL
jgi:sugar phosphate isomerase/epimerase